MLTSRGASGKRIEDLRKEKLLRDIDVINKSIYPERSRPSGRPKSKTGDCGRDPEPKIKKSFWDWKPLRAFSHIRNRRFNCSFSLRVHSIEGLPGSFKGTRLCVHWRRRDAEFVTRPCRVSQGKAVFEEELRTVCSVHGSRNGNHDSAKYEAKHFLVFASMGTAPETDLGKHRVDLTRMLPLTLEELEEDRSSGKWTISYKLSGKAKGAVLNVSFMYAVLSDDELKKKMKKNAVITKTPELHQEIPPLHLPLCKSVDALYHKLDEETNSRRVEQECSSSTLTTEEDDSRAVIMEELETALQRVACLREDLDSPSPTHEGSISLDDAEEAVANEFLDLVGLDRPEPEPESPRELLLREFERETSSLFAYGGSAMEDRETSELMKEWGMSEKTFGPVGTTACSSGVDPLPPVGEGLGHFVTTKDGGFLRSMNPSLFRDAKCGGSLIMQVSRPVVVPAELGSAVDEILHRLASVGMERLSAQATGLMPLENVTGLTVQHIAWDTSVRGGLLDDAPSAGGSECATLKELAPLAVDKIEALSIEGLRIQSGMPTTVGIGGVAALNLAGGGEGSGVGGGDDDGLMSLSLTLDEWTKLDSGDVEPDERTCRILAAHHANPVSLGRRRRRGCGLLGNNFTVALMVQLRDPSRDYEPVGVPMLALVQAERVFRPAKPQIYASVRRRKETDNGFSDDGSGDREEDRLPVLKIGEVHVAGFRTEMAPPPTPGIAASRWLIANGMGKPGRHSYIRSHSPATVGPPSGGASLWSISARFAEKIKSFSLLGSYKRNPDIFL